MLPNEIINENENKDITNQSQRPVEKSDWALGIIHKS